MGTRHLTVVIKRGKECVCQYGQYNGYLSHQGRTVFRFLSNQANISTLSAACDSISYLSTPGFENQLAPFMARFNSKSELFGKDEYWWETFANRGVGADILAAIVAWHRSRPSNRLPEEFGDRLFLQEYDREPDFADWQDVWIEYSYVLNLDTNRLEVWGHGKKLRDVAFSAIPDIAEEDFVDESIDYLER